MSAKVRHRKVSAAQDTSDGSLIQPSDWNEDHVVTGDLSDFLPVGVYGVGTLMVGEWLAKVGGDRLAVGESFSVGIGAGLVELRSYDVAAGLTANLRTDGEVWRLLSVGRVKIGTTLAPMATYIRVA